MFTSYACMSNLLDSCVSRLCLYEIEEMNNKMKTAITKITRSKLKELKLSMRLIGKSDFNKLNYFKRNKKLSRFNPDV